MRSYKSYTDLRALAKSYLSFSEKHDTQRAKSFTEEGLSPRCSPTCVNFRDCGVVSTALKPNTIYRSSQVVSSEEIQNLELKAVLDLRVLKKPCKRHAEERFGQAKRSDSRIQAFRSLRSLSSASSGSDEETVPAVQGASFKPWRATASVCPVCTDAFGKLHHVKVPIFHSDLVPWTTKLRVFGKLPTRTKALAIGEVCHLRNPERLVAAAVVDPDVMGPLVLYKLLLDHSKASMAKALRIFCKPENYPVLVHCIHGKDRTGLIIMLLLLLCDVSPKLVVADYIQSELQLKAGRDKGNLRELDDFLVTDNVIASKAETMVETIAHLDSNYGSARGYAQAVGLSDEEISSIRTNFMKQADPADLLNRLSRGSDVRLPSSPQRDAWGSPMPRIDSEPDPGQGPAAPGTDVTGGGRHSVISELALDAADEAVEEKLERSPEALRQHRSSGAISVEKIPRPRRSRPSDGSGSGRTSGDPEE